MTWIEPLDLETLLVNSLAGSYDIFVGLALLVIAGLAAYFRIPTELSLILISIFFIMMSPFIGSGYMFLIILIATIIVYFALAKLVK